MKKKRQSNKGFSLVELIIALAILAFLMTAVSAFMGSSVLRNRQAKADLKVSTSAQLVYNEITDCIMQANDIILVGYLIPKSKTVDFSKPGAEISYDLGEKLYFVKDKSGFEDIEHHYSAYGMSGSFSYNEAGTGNVRKFSTLKPDDRIYVTKLIVKTSVPIDMTQTNDGDPSKTVDQVMMHHIEGGNHTIKCTVKGSQKIYNENDTCYHEFDFEKDKCYYGKLYAYMVKLNDHLNMASDASKADHIYTAELSYLEYDNGTEKEQISGCVAKVDADKGQIGIDLYFNKLNMTYDTLGMVNIRNSHVLKSNK